MKKLKMLLLTTCLISSTSAISNVVFIKKGTAAPSDGYLFDEVSAKKTREELIEKDGLVKINQSLEKIVEAQKQVAELYEKKSDKFEKRADALSLSLEKSNNSSFYMKAGIFILGAALGYGLTRGK